MTLELKLGLAHKDELLATATNKLLEKVIPIHLALATPEDLVVHRAVLAPDANDHVVPSRLVITKFVPEVVFATATKRLFPKVTAVQPIVELNEIDGVVRRVQVIPSGLTFTQVVVQFLPTATKRLLPNVTLDQMVVLAGLVTALQFTPSELVKTEFEVVVATKVGVPLTTP